MSNADGVYSEVSLHHPDDIYWFTSCDETHHVFSNETDKGGSRSRRWINPSFARSGDRGVKGHLHTTGVYTTNLAGEALPPLYIFESKAKNEENFSIPSDVCIGLPTVRGKYGTDKVRKYHSNIAVRHKGSMNTSLWHQFVETTHCKLYPRMSKEVVRCSETNLLLSGPCICKTDAGPGRLASEAESLDFRLRMWELGFIILLSIPNATAATAEMDQAYATFQPECKKSTQRVASMKLAARVEIRK